jgi:hypothetical protein
MRERTSATSTGFFSDSVLMSVAIVRKSEECSRGHNGCGGRREMRLLG